MNTVNIIGRLTATPDVRKTQNGISMCRFSIAVKRRFKVNNEAVTDFFNVIAWKETAEYIGRYLSKGQKIGIEGSLQPSEYKTKSGEMVTTFVIVANSVEACGPTPNSNNEKTNSEQVDFTLCDLDEDLPF